MPNCSVCGESTQLHVMGEPICVKCEETSPEKRKVRSEQSKGLPERAAGPVDTPSRGIAA
jgi:hypothetical protein